MQLGAKDMLPHTLRMCSQFHLELAGHSRAPSSITKGAWSNPRSNMPWVRSEALNRSSGTRAL